MASKQKVFNQYKKLVKEYATLSGDTYNLDEDCFYRIHTTNDMIVLSEKIERDIAHKKKSIAIDKWFATDEGAKWYNEKTDRLSVVKEILTSSLNVLKTEIRPLIVSELGDGWEITDLSSERMTIAILDKDDKEKFSYYFELLWYNNPWYDNPDFGKKFHLSFSYSTMGSFDIDENPSRVELVLGMAKLLGNKDLIRKLNKLIGEYHVQKELLSKEKYEIEDELRNPPLPSGDVD